MVQKAWFTYSTWPCKSQARRPVVTETTITGFKGFDTQGIPEFVRSQDQAQWRPLWRPALADKRVMILGYGQIGAAIEDRLAPFQVDIVYCTNW